MEVTNRPIHPEKATGCSTTSIPAGRSPYMIQLNSGTGADEPSVIPLSAGSGWTLERCSPIIITGMDTATPIKGPAAPISISMRLSRIGDLILMKAPNVPIREGPGMKNGGVTSTPCLRARK